MQKWKNKSENSLEPLKRCRYCGRVWIQRLSPYRCPSCDFPLDPMETWREKIC
ncbi:hypothetical protein G4O51_11735 [Candidatus Bathyarchaeota archaeon A05DMB-2]|nr:hypothetical protein [Candidatus Bathyarchaeota archaeon A05DMB-2]